MAAVVAQMRLDGTFICTLLVGNVFLHSGKNDISIQLEVMETICPSHKT